jgi:glycosyltransferase involved in cell wall biosynthesis
MKEWHKMVTSLPFKINYTAYLRADLLDRYEDVPYMLAESGLLTAFHGIESLGEKASTVIGKGWSGKKARDYIPKLYHDIWDNKVYQTLSFIIGLVTSGNFKKRNLGLLIEAFKEVAKTNPKAKLFIAGGNIDQKYKDQAPKEGVVFAPPIIDVKNYYYLLDVFVLPAHIEEFGRSVLEAMYCGVPVITTKFVGASEILEGSSREFILDEINQANLVLKLNKLMDHQVARSVADQNNKTAKAYSSEVQSNVFGETLKKFGII